MTLTSHCARALKPAACLASVVLAACGAATVSVTPSSSTSASASPTSSPRPFTTAGFATSIPEGWNDATAKQSGVPTLSGGGSVVMLLVALDQGTISARTTPQPVADDQLAQYLSSTTPSGATTVSSAEPVNVGGVSGVVITYDLASTGGTSEIENMVVNQGGNTYDIQLETAQSRFTQDAVGLQQVLDSWTWG